MIEEQRFSNQEGQAVTGCPTLPPPFRRDLRTFREGRHLRGPVPMHFVSFYRAHLRFVTGARLRSSDVSRFYGAWASANGAPSLTMREVKRAMGNIGHRSINSNGVQYCDAALAADCPDLPDNFPGMPLPVEAHARAIGDRLDAMITELSSIRAEVVGPHSH